MSATGDQHARVGLAIADARIAASERNLYAAVHAAAAGEILRCLDPRHATTLAEAVHAVYKASPYRELAAHLGVAPDPEPPRRTSTR